MAQEDIDVLLNKQPPALPANVARVKADGTPTTHLLDWELFQTDWFKNNIVATDRRITEVKAEADEAIAAFSEDIEALVEADTAMVAQITSVSARANQATANGQIYFAAMAAPTGAIAAYGVFLTAGNAYTGMRLIAKSDGTSAIMFDANYFALNDSGTAKNVFTYDGSVFRFLVPVLIGTEEITARAVTAPVVQSATNTLSIGPGSTSGWQNVLSVTVPGDVGYCAIITCDFEYIINLGGANQIGFDGDYRIVRNGSAVIASGRLFPVTDRPFRESISDFESSVATTNTYTLQVNLSIATADGGTPTFRIQRRNIIADLRKR